MVSPQMSSCARVSSASTSIGSGVHSEALGGPKDCLGPLHGSLHPQASATRERMKLFIVNSFHVQEPQLDTPEGGNGCSASGVHRGGDWSLAVAKPT